MTQSLCSWYEELVRDQHNDWVFFSLLLLIYPNSSGQDGYILSNRNSILKTNYDLQYAISMDNLP